MCGIRNLLSVSTPRPDRSMPFRVSVIIPVFNAATRVRRAVESALALPEVAEVVLVEDGSPDNALEVCTELARLDRVTLVRHSDGANHGAGASRNLGVRHAASEFVAFLDADDWYLPNRFSYEPTLFADPAVDGVYGAVVHRFESTELRDAWFSQGRPEVTTVTGQVTSDELLDVLMWSHPLVKGDFSTLAVTVRRNFFWRVGGFFEPLRLQQDTHLWKRMAAAGRLEAGSITEPIAAASVHSANRMTNLTEQERYRELWWSSLKEEFRRPGMDPRAIDLWRKGYSRFRATRPPRWKAVTALANWAVRNPKELRVRYGHFDLTLRRIFNDSASVARFLSAKNQILP
jgi:glycosyltransferase involved in cell wall biosynthesis